MYTNDMKIKDWRPELNGYEEYAQILCDDMNKNDPLKKMTVTDVLKILLEEKIAEKHPEVEVVKRRRIYRVLDY